MDIQPAEGMFETMLARWYDKMPAIIQFQKQIIETQKNKTPKIIRKFESNLKNTGNFTGIIKPLIQKLNQCQIQIDCETQRIQTIFDDMGNITLGRRQDLMFLRGPKAVKLFTNDDEQKKELSEIKDPDDKQWVENAIAYYKKQLEGSIEKLYATQLALEVEPRKIDYAIKKANKIQLLIRDFFNESHDFFYEIHRTIRGNSSRVCSVYLETITAHMKEVRQAQDQWENESLLHLNQKDSQHVKNSIAKDVAYLVYLEDIYKDALSLLEEGEKAYQLAQKTQTMPELKEQDKKIINLYNRLDAFREKERPRRFPGNPSQFKTRLAPGRS